MKKKMIESKEMITLSMLLTLAVVMGYLEAIFPIPIGIPGMKLGLCNLAILFSLYRYGYKKALLITLLRVVIVGALMTNVMMILYSLAGAIVSLTGMALLKKMPAFSIIGVSIGGGVLHNIAQICVAIIVIENTAILYYLPFLLITGVVAGMIIGVVDQILLKRVKKEMRKN